MLTTLADIFLPHVLTSHGLLHTPHYILYMYAVFWLDSIACYINNLGYVSAYCIAALAAITMRCIFLFNLMDSEKPVNEVTVYNISHSSGPLWSDSYHTFTILVTTRAVSFAFEHMHMHIVQ